MSATEPFAAATPTLASLAADLGADLLSIVVAPAGTDTGIAEPVVHDPDEPLVAGHGDLILAVGLDASGPAAPALLAEAAALGAAGVVLKRRPGGVDALVEPARRTGIALLTTAAEVAWGQLYALVRTSVAATARTSATHVSGTAIGDLFGLADAIAAAVGGAVTIEDPQSRVLAFSSLQAPIDAAREATILGRQVPDDWLSRLVESGVFERLRRSTGVIHVEFPGQAAPRRAIAVRGGGSLIASIWVAEGERPLGVEADAVLEEASRIAALHLLRHRMSDDLERRVRGELLRSLLTGDAEAAVVARELGLPADALLTVIAVHALQLTSEEPDTPLVNERMVDLIAGYFQAFRRKVSVAAVDGTVYVLVVAERGGSRERFAQLTREAIKNTANGLRVRLRAGIGAPVEALSEIPASRAQADQALRVGALAEPNAAVVVDIEEVFGHALLLEIGDLLGDRPRRRSRPLEKLYAHDAAHGTAYVATLRAYLDRFGDPGRAAAQLQIHPNTLRYRMRRIVDLTGLDMHDPDDRFPVELQLRLLGDPC